MSSSLPEIILQRASGQEEALNAYAGQVLLVVNTASQCGFTPQYEALEQLQQHFGGEGFTVLAFPCNQFGRQEPGDDETIASFCETRFHTTFPLFAKTEVNGPEAHPPLYALKGGGTGGSGYAGDQVELYEVPGGPPGPGAGALRPEYGPPKLR